MIEVYVTLEAPVLLTDGPAFPRQVVKVDPDDLSVQMLLDSGGLVPIDEAEAETRADLMAEAKELGIDGRSKLSRNELAEQIAHAKGEQRAAEEHALPEEGFEL